MEPKRLCADDKASMDLLSQKCCPDASAASQRLAQITTNRAIWVRQSAARVVIFLGHCAPRTVGVRDDNGVSRPLVGYHAFLMRSRLRLGGIQPPRMPLQAQ